MSDSDLSPLTSKEDFAKHIDILEGLKLDLKIAVDGFPELREKTAQELCRSLHGIKGKRAHMLSSVYSAASAVYCHELFFKNIVPRNLYPSLPKDRVSDMLKNSFGSPGNFFYLARTLAAGSHAPGFLWLCKRNDYGRLKLGLTRLPMYSIPNPKEALPLLCIDLWEHAYIGSWGRDVSGFTDAYLRQTDWNTAFSPIFNSSP